MGRTWVMYDSYMDHIGQELVMYGSYMDHVLVMWVHMGHVWVIHGSCTGHVSHVLWVIWVNRWSWIGHT